MFSPTLKASVSVILMRQLAAAPLEIAEQVVQAAEQVLAAGLGGLAQHLGVGQQEVGGAERVDELAGIEVDLLRGLGRQAVHMASPRR